MITALRPRRRAGRVRLLLALTAVPAMLAGLLAMHVLSGNAGETGIAGHHAMVFAQPADAHVAATDMDHHAAASPSSACGPDCEREHRMSAAACVLAILAAAFAFAVPAGVRRMGWLLRPIRSLPSLSRSPAEPAPPSLLVLSISRT